MDGNRGLRKITVSGAAGLPRKRHKIISPGEEDREMEMTETVKLRDRERFLRKDRKVQNHFSGNAEGCGGSERSDSSDDEHRQVEEEARTHRPSSPYSSLGLNRRRIRTLRSAPVLRAVSVADEIIRVPVPRRARSTLTRKMNESWSSRCGGLIDGLGHRRFSPSSVTRGLIGSGGVLPLSSSFSSKRITKSAEPRTGVLNNAPNFKSSSTIQDDIEIEVVEALFDLKKQSQSESQTSGKVEKLDRDSEFITKDANVNTDLQSFPAEDGFTVQNQQSLKADVETLTDDSVEEQKKEEMSEKGKFPENPGLGPQSVYRDEFVNREKMASPKESESPPSVEERDCSIEDPKVTKANSEAIAVGRMKKARKLEIDLMTPPPLPSSPEERDVLFDTRRDPSVITEDGQKQSGNNQLPNLDLGKHSQDMSRDPDGIGSSRQQWVHKEQKNMASPFPAAVSEWPSALPHSRNKPPLPAALPINGVARSSKSMQFPQFRFSQPRPKRCSTHQFIASNIQCHQQLVNNSLCAGPSSASTLSGAKHLKLNSTPPMPKFIPGNPSNKFSTRANPYMGFLQKNGCPFPISTNTAMPPNGGTFSLKPPHGQEQTGNQQNQGGFKVRAEMMSFGSTMQCSDMFRMLPDVARNGSMMPPVPQMPKLKNFQATEGKNGKGSAHLDDGPKGLVGKSSTLADQSLDSSKPDCIDAPGKRPCPSSTGAPTTSGVSLTIPKFQQQGQHQQHLIQFQKHNMQLTGTASDAAGKAASMSHQADTSSNGPCQKSSPVCRRTVASILSTCPSQLS